jgi:L-threonylcarbamoyladenylate synthase
VDRQAVVGNGGVSAAAAAIARGEVVAYPTETFYGLGVDPRRPAALQRLLELKGREERDKPLLLLAAGLEDLAPWVGALPPGFDRLAARFWPGPLTLVVPAAIGIAAPLLGPSGGIAVRLTPHPLARRLIRACGTAITGTSANHSGEPPARTAAAVAEAFGGARVHVLDGGETPGGAPSTIIELSERGTARLLRAGVLDTALVGRVIELSG